jgi:hypothetical protein
LQFADHGTPPSGINGVRVSPFPEVLESNPLAGVLDKAGMNRMTREAVDEIAKIIAKVAPLPLKDAAWALNERMRLLDTLEGRPTAEQVRRFRAMTPEQQSQHMRRSVRMPMTGRCSAI